MQRSLSELWIVLAMFVVAFMIHIVVVVNAHRRANQLILGLRGRVWEVLCWSVFGATLIIGLIAVFSQRPY
jgi:uncharacterized membrane protein